MRKPEEPAEGAEQLWLRLLRGPNAFAAFPEIDAVIRCGSFISKERAKELAHQIIQNLRIYIPKAIAMREGVRAVEELRKTVIQSAETLVRVDLKLAVDPDSVAFLTPRHELAVRSACNLRRLIINRRIESDEQWNAADSEACAQARAEMVQRGRAIADDIAPDPSIMAAFRLKEFCALMEQNVLAIAVPAADSFIRNLEFGLTPQAGVGRPGMELSMFIAWLFQDTGPKIPSDSRVKVLIEDACEGLPEEFPNLVPSEKTIARWRKEREAIPGICPHRDVSSKLP